MLLALGCAPRPAAPVATPELARVAFAQAAWADARGDAEAARERRALAALVGGDDPRTRAALATAAPLRPDDGVSDGSRAACAGGLTPTEAARRAAAGHAALPGARSLRLWAAWAYDAGDLGPVVAWIASHDAAGWGGAWADAAGEVERLAAIPTGDASAGPAGPSACADLSAAPREG
jgi:hypothetical protein